MALEEYDRKRRFQTTPEPKGRRASRASKTLKEPSFVVQLHHASVRHYDFRLEVAGVLRSWAVPKGPSFRVGEKRLAVQVEDHPLEYATFEGHIPEHNYGAGHVAVFDRGTWSTEGDPAAAIGRGKLEFEMHGEHLRGRWVLVRTRKSASKPQWLLLKRSDSFAGDFEADDLLDGLESPPATAVKARRAKSRNSPSESAARHRSTGRGRAPKATAGDLISQAAAIDGARIDKVMSQWTEPMLATATEKPPQGDDWLHEWKWDGYRMEARVAWGVAAFTSRNGLDWTGRLPQLCARLQEVGVDCTLDGELVSMTKQGHSDFNALQRALKSEDVDGLSYVAFDLLRIGDIDLTGAPLIERKELLRTLVASATPWIGYSEHIVGHGPQVFAAAVQRGLEGVISKRCAASYSSGRSGDWLKIKPVVTREFVVIGYTEPKGSRRGLGALVLAAPEGDSLRFVGRVGSGLRDEALETLAEDLSRIKRKSPPVDIPAHVKLPATTTHWVNPQHVVEVQFRGWGKEGLLRQASFRRVRADRSAASDFDAADPIASPSSPGRVVYPGDGFTKQDVFDYYLAVADRLLGEIAGRPLSVVRCPDGIAGAQFFQKHAGPGFGAAMRRVPVRKKDGDTADYFAVDDIAGLMHLVQMNAIEFHPWGSRATALEKPDRMVFDLDPDESLAWTDVRRAAVEVRDRLRLAGLESWPKLTGGKGVHVEVPLVADAEWPRVRAFCEAFAQAMAAEQPQRYVATASRKQRRGRIFIDWLRNGRGATSVASWSLRARPGAPVAVPISWPELARVRRADRYTIRDAAERGPPALVAETEALQQRLPELD